MFIYILYVFKEEEDKQQSIFIIIFAINFRQEKILIRKLIYILLFDLKITVLPHFHCQVTCNFTYVILPKIIKMT